MNKPIASEELRSAWLEGPETNPHIAWEKYLMERCNIDEQQAQKFIRDVEDWVRTRNFLDERTATRQWDGRDNTVPEGYFTATDEYTHRRCLKLKNGKSFYTPEDIVGQINDKLIRAGLLEMPMISLEEIAAERFGIIETEIDDGLGKVAKAIADALNADADNSLNSAMMRSPLEKKEKPFIVISPGSRDCVGMTISPIVDKNIEDCVDMLCNYVARNMNKLEKVCNELHIMLTFSDAYLVNNADPALAKIYTKIAEKLFTGHPIEIYEYILPNFREHSLKNLFTMSGMFCIQATDTSASEVS